MLSLDAVPRSMIMFVCYDLIRFGDNKNAFSTFVSASMITNPETKAVQMLHLSSFVRLPPL